MAVILFGQSRLQLGQRRAGARGNHQFARLVADDAGERARIKPLAAWGCAGKKSFASSAANAQRGLVCGGGAHAVGKG